MKSCSNRYLFDLEKQRGREREEEKKISDGKMELFKYRQRTTHKDIAEKNDILPLYKVIIPKILKVKLPVQTKEEQLQDMKYEVYGEIEPEEIIKLDQDKALQKIMRLSSTFRSPQDRNNRLAKGKIPQDLISQAEEIAESKIGKKEENQIEHTNYSDLKKLLGNWKKVLDKKNSSNSLIQKKKEKNLKLEDKHEILLTSLIKNKKTAHDMKDHRLLQNSKRQRSFKSPKNNELRIRTRISRRNALRDNVMTQEKLMSGHVDIVSNIAERITNAYSNGNGPNILSQYCGQIKCAKNNVEYIDIMMSKLTSSEIAVSRLGDKINEDLNDIEKKMCYLKRWIDK